MKTNFNHLPDYKKTELSKIVNIIAEISPAEMIILFGSYARNDWVEEKFDEENYRYQSDFDILVIVETKSDSAQTKFERDLEEKIDQHEEIKTPVSIIVHDIDFINRRLSKAQYFFTDIKKEGIVLYNSEKFQLKDARELTNKERYHLAKQDFDYWIDSAHEFEIDFMNAFKRGSYKNAAFLLHQVTERLYSAILLVFTRYKPNTHDLAVLRKLANSLESRLIRIFSLDNVEDKRLFKLLRKAYVEARYKPNYAITHDELSKLFQQVKELKKIGQLICAEKIESFIADHKR